MKVVSFRYEILQRINAREFLVYRKSWRIERSFDGPPDYISETDTSVIYWLIGKKDRTLADGESLDGIDIEPTGKVRTYHSVSGADITAREIRERVAGEVPLFSQADFVAALKAGKTWELPGFSRVRCEQCGGDGKLGSLSKNSECEPCGGKGEFISSYLVKW